MRNNRFWILLALAVILVVILVGGAGGSGPPFDPRSVEPDGAKGIVEVLEELGVDVEISQSVPRPSDAGALVLVDRLLQDDRAAVDRWVEAGGVLVVADPTSPFVPPTQQNFAGALDAGDCPLAALTNAERIEIERGAFFDPEGAGWCFGTGDRAHIVASPKGEGVVVAVGGQQLFTNAALDEADGAVVAVNLLVPTRDGNPGVTFVGPSVVPLEDAGALIAPRVINAIMMGLAAFLIYALHRARRLGRVVAEPLPVHIHSSELILQAGVLSERSDDPSGSAAVIRNDFVGRAAASLSLRSDDDVAAMSAAIHRATGQPEEDIAAALTRPVRDAADLVDVAGQIARLDHALFDPPAAAPFDADPSPSADPDRSDADSADRSDPALQETS